MNCHQLVSEILEVLQIHNASLCLWTREDLQLDRMNWKEILKKLQYLRRDWQGRFQLGMLPLNAEGAYPQDCTVEQPRNQVSDMHFDKSPNPLTFQCRKTSFKTEVCSWAIFRTDAMLWIKEVEMVESIDDLETLQSIGGRRFPIEMLDAKIASAQKKIILNPHFKKKVSLEEQVAQVEDRFLRGRQIAYMIYEYFRVTAAHEAAFLIIQISSVPLYMSTMSRI